jgi:uncharacterized heparinase superfamily protein
VTSVPPPDDGLDEEEAAISADGDPPLRLVAEKGRSLAGWLSEGFDRLTWRTPLPGVRSNGAPPERLAASPDDPIIGDGARGRAIMAGRLTFRGETQAIADLDFARPVWSAAFGEYLHGFAWLRDLSTVAPLAQAAPIAMRLTAAWLAAHGEQVSDPVWSPEMWGRRLLFWVLHAPLVTPGTDPDHDARVLDTLARGARHLDRHADKATPGAARIAAWCGVVAAGLLIPGNDPRRGFGEAGLGRALAGGLFEDGGAVSRSPAVLLDTVMLLAMLREIYAACAVDVPEAVVAALMRAVPALLGSLHGDRMLSSWQGGGPSPGSGDADQIAAVIAASGVRTRPLRQSRDWGYQRMAAGSAVLIVDAAPPPIARLVAGGCASTLAFEFSDGPTRLIVNCGGARGGHAALPPALLEGLRTTAAHSTLTLDDTNSTAIHPDGTLGRGVGQVELSRQEADNASRIEASHDGYVRRWGLLHRRQLMLTGDGRELRGEDALLPSGRRRSAPVPFAIRFHLGAGVAATAAADGQGAVLHPGNGMDWQLRCRGGALGIEDSVWIDGNGRPIATQQLVIAGEAAPGGAQIGWMLKRMV